MKVFDALYHIGHMVDAGIKGTFTLRISDKEKALVFVIDMERLIVGSDNKYDWEAGQALASALVKGYEVVELAWKGTDL